MTGSTSAPASTEISAIAAEAFVFGYPLVLMDVTRNVWTCPRNPEGAPPNRLNHLREFPDASFTAVVSPNADTLYSTAILDLAAEPVVLATPAAHGRYHLMPLLSAWTDVFASPGTRTTGDGPATFAITGPRWEGTLPDGVQELRSPTALAWLIGRTQTNGKDDYAAVRRFQDGLELAPLSAWLGEGSRAAENVPDDGVDIETPPPAQVAAMDGEAFLGRLAALMVDNPPAPDDAPALERFARIGLLPGAFAPPAGEEAAIRDGVAAGLAQVIGAAQHLAADANAGAWRVHAGLGAYGTDYLKRAVVAMGGLGANLDADSMYPNTSVDGDGAPLDGRHRYVLRFGPGQTPPVRAFWSLTMYDEHHYFVDNPIDRYAIGDRDPLDFGEDGSLELWLQHDAPGGERDRNWLPAPGGPFGLILRLYWPQPQVLDGSWTPPPVQRRD